MIIIEPSVSCISITDDAERLIEYAGRTIYGTADKIQEGTSDGFIYSLITHNLDYILKHAYATLKFTVDRFTSHELLKTVEGAFCEEDLRFVKYAGRNTFGEIVVIAPPELHTNDWKDWEASCLAAEVGYKSLIRRQVPPRIAQAVLPMCLKTETIITARFTEWRKLIQTRKSAKEHPTMQSIVKMVHILLKEKAPACFGDL